MKTEKRMITESALFCLLFIAFFFQLVIAFGMIDMVFACNIYKPRLSSSYGFYWGKATIGSHVEVMQGDEIRAYVDTVKTNGGCVGYFQINKAGFYGGMAVYEDDSTTPEKDGVSLGDVIQFTICHDGKEYICNEMAIWDAGNINNHKEFNITGSSEIKDDSEPSDDRAFTEKDAICAFQTYLMICPTDCGDCSRSICDINGDNLCTPADALYIYRKAIGVMSYLYPSLWVFKKVSASGLFCDPL
ncbi:hypothetical protein JXL19_08245 [bacterium]|nr:hypothetical protein [bacterium]